MRVLVQRVSRASVTIEGEVVGAIGQGLLVLLGITASDGDAQIEFLAEKLLGLRIFPDDEGKMNRSVRDIGGGLLVVSQFTLYGDCRKGRRPSFIDAAPPPISEPLYERFVERLRRSELEVQTGRFGAMMDVELVNDGPVTLMIEAPA
ncbi:D-tyrosyl-tRNA(Tyr) deacylase [Planctomycetes bacterium Pan216]|uniref:D-aminoacyl-tRNA deacylase n=1 Tax=Kolteria novifilia TaxID=2527975 RepID=A0A518BA47_9BACT|nr:D-tyrosyl-tRNA(Tyr) deacylase [Planctomycetes bacterium Pan216]